MVSGEIIPGAEVQAIIFVYAVQAVYDNLAQFKGISGNQFAVHRRTERRDEFLTVQPDLPFNTIGRESFLKLFKASFIKV